MNESIYIVRVPNDGKFYDYEYGNLEHAIEHYNNEVSASLIEYKNEKYYLMMVKGE